MSAVLEQIPAQARVSDAGPIDPYVAVIRKVLGTQRGNINVLSSAHVREGNWIEVIMYVDNVDRNVAFSFTKDYVFSSTVDVSANGASDEHLAGLVGKIVVDLCVRKPNYAEGNGRNAYLHGTFLFPRLQVSMEEVQAVAREVIGEARKSAEVRALEQLAKQAAGSGNASLADNLATGLARILRPDQCAQFAKTLFAAARASAR